MRAGTSSVLRARFADAQFFWELTRSVARPTTCEAPHVTYERRLGSYSTK